MKEGSKCFTWGIERGSWDGTAKGQGIRIPWTNNIMNV